MGIQKKLTIVGLFFTFIILLYFLFSTDDSNKKKKMRSEDLSFLLGGAPASGSGSSSGGQNPMGVRGENSKSVFDSDFYNSGSFTYDEKNAPEGTGARGDAPINPQTGKPYPEEAMAQFDRLRELFPDNELIPKRLTPEVKAEQEALNQKLANATSSVMGGSATEQDINFYYGHMEKQTNDRLEIIEYLIDAQGGEDEEMDKKFKEVLDGVKAQMAQIQTEKEAAYKKIGK
jgi:hypothetical protein